MLSALHRGGPVSGGSDGAYEKCVQFHSQVSLSCFCAPCRCRHPDTCPRLTHENSKRAFQVKFSQWNFPTKQRLAHKDERVVSRVKELWEKNIQQKEILRVLNEEDGLDINERELRRLRARNGWLLRAYYGDKTQSTGESDASPQQDGAPSPPRQGQTGSLLPVPEPTTNSASDQPMENHGPSAAIEHRGRESQRKRRRQRQEANGALVRFPSEMTIEEAKKLLRLESGDYEQVRTCFVEICREEGVIKKTIVGPERWEASKNRLIDQCPQLQHIGWGAKEDVEAKKLALDIICTTVTKWIRMSENRTTLADVKNALGLNPADSRKFRVAFRDILLDANFATKTAASSPAEWEDFKNRAVESSGLSQKIEDSKNSFGSQAVLKALDRLALDVRKRMKADLVRRAAGKPPPAPKPKVPKKPQKQLRPRRQRQGVPESQVDSPPDSYESRSIGLHGSSPAGGNAPDADADGGNFEAMHDISDASQTTFAASGGSMASQLPLSLQPQSTNMSGPTDGLPPPHRVLGSSLPAGMVLGSQIGSPMLLEHNSPTAYMGQQYVQSQFSVPPTASSPAAAFHPVASIPTALAVFLRLHPSSTFVTNMPMWIGTLNTNSVQDLRRVATERFPDAVCQRIEGILKHDGGELALQIENDQELCAYIAHVQPSAPVFTVQLSWKT